MSPRRRTPRNQGRSHGGWVTSAMVRAIPAPGKQEPKWLIQSQLAAPSPKETPQRWVGWKVHPILCFSLPTLLPWHQKAALLGQLSSIILQHPSQKRPRPYGWGAEAHFLTPGEERQCVRKNSYKAGSWPHTQTVVWMRMQTSVASNLCENQSS